jgi:glycosyltransferase involved in cell wall biosynthesis
MMNPLKVLLVHNYYLLPGGEDEVLRREKMLLVNAGHPVIEYSRQNSEIAGYSLARKAGLAFRTIWAGDSYHHIESLLKKERPNVAHFHNTMPLISPAAYYACAAAGVPVVQTLDNLRLLCPAGTLYRDGDLCEDCVGRTVPWPAVQHGCYQGSRVRSGVVASMLVAHRLLRTWHGKIAMYLVSTEFYRRKFIEAGIPATKIALKPHFVDGHPACRERTGDYALFVGRLAREKGVLVLLEAWQDLQQVPLKIRGDGPLAGVVQSAANRKGSPIEVVPRCSRDELFELIGGARFLIWPSQGYYETFGLIAIEAFACGVPVIASLIGVMREIVDGGRTGLHFIAGNPKDLAEKVAWAWTHPTELERMGRAARADFEAKYTAEHQYEMLIDIYRGVLQQAGQTSCTTSTSTHKENHAQRSTPSL